MLESSHGIELSKTVGFLRLVFDDVVEWERAPVRLTEVRGLCVRPVRLVVCWSPEAKPVEPGEGLTSVTTGGPLRASTPQ